MSLYRHEFAVCPWCNGETGSRVDHLYDESPRNFGPWRCDACHKSFQGTINAPSDVVITKAYEKPSARAMTLLKFDGKEGPVFFVMDHRHYDAEEPDQEKQEHDRYFYEEHSCPTNWLRDCVAVIEDGDTDPHGFLSFVRSVEVPDDFDEDDEQWAILFPEAFAGETIDGTATEIKGALVHAKAPIEKMEQK